MIIFIMQACPKLIERFKEREENVKVNSYKLCRILLLYLTI